MNKVNGFQRALLYHYTSDDKILEGPLNYGTVWFPTLIQSVVAPFLICCVYWISTENPKWKLVFLLKKLTLKKLKTNNLVKSLLDEVIEA